MNIPFLCSIPLLATLSTQVPAKQVEYFGVSHILNNKVHVASDMCYLLRTDCVLPEKKTPQIEEFGLPLFGSSYSPFGVHLVDGVIWCDDPTLCAVGRVPLEDLKFIDMLQFKDDKLSKMLFAEYIKKYPQVLPNGGWGAAQVWNVRDVADVVLKHGQFGKPKVYHTLPGDFPIPINASFPTGPTTLKTFILRLDKKLEVWESHGTWRPDLGEWQIKSKRKEEEDITVPFVSAFYVTTRKQIKNAKEEELYFLTQSGALYVAFPAADKKPRQVKALWQDKEKPITHLIVDRDQDKNYCFGKSKDGKEEFFFKLDSMVGVNPVKRDQIQPVKGLEHKRLAAVLEYVQVLPGHKKVEKQP